MRIIRITKKFEFEMAHALHGYNGPCRHIHGHSYKLSVTVAGTPLNDAGSEKNGMVIDFSILKSIVKKNIVEKFDHSLVVNKNIPLKDLQKFKQLFDNLVLLPYQPTCENLLLDFAGRILKLLPESVKLHSLKLQETSSSFAEWFAEDNSL